MQAIRFRGQIEVNKTIADVKGASYQKRFEQTVPAFVEGFKTETPDNVKLTFHNSERGPEWGGWHTGNYRTKTDQVSLFVNDGLQEHRFNLAPRKMGFSLFGLQLTGESVKQFVARAVEEAKEQLPSILDSVSKVETGEWRVLKVKQKVYDATVAAGAERHSTRPLYLEGAHYRNDTIGVLAMNTPAVLAKIEANLLAQGFTHRADAPQTVDSKSLVFANVPVELRNSNQLGVTVGRVGNDGYYVVTLAKRIKHLLRSEGLGVQEYASPKLPDKLLTLNWDQLASYRRSSDEPLGGSLSHAVLIEEPENFTMIRQFLRDHGFVQDPNTVETPERNVLLAPENWHSGQHKLEIRTRASVKADPEFEKHLTYR